MVDQLVEYLETGNLAANVGPNAKETFLEKAETAYNSGTNSRSVYYQVRALYQAFKERYNQIDANLLSEAETDGNEIHRVEKMHQQMSAWEKKDFKSNTLLQYALNTLKENWSAASNMDMDAKAVRPPMRTCNFLNNTTNAKKGVAQIQTTCQEMPEEWTILQLCKGLRTDTTYSVFPRIKESNAAIYVSLLRHARSAHFPAPICMRFFRPELAELFVKFAGIADRFKECINIDPKQCNTKESKQKYWKVLAELDVYLETAVMEFKNFFFPWNFLFTGIPHASSALVQQYQAKAFAAVDDYCSQHGWPESSQVLLSLAALHCYALSETEMQAICKILAANEREQAAGMKLLLKLQRSAVYNSISIAMQVACSSSSDGAGNFASSAAAAATTALKHYPCILIVDERLDHFYWEELNVHQEFCRVNSLQCLWRLFRLYRTRIRSGYLDVSINDGGCIVNPDNNLPKTELRMRRFFEYWLPHWHKKYSEKPTQDELLKDFFKRACYVYAGHGSGLQYINGKNIAKHQITGVVFLFGCDSSRLHSKGLFSELIGPHLYYHAAMCPTLVGTLMPALDANMDGVATDILSRWIAPNNKQIVPWEDVDRTVWIKEGVIKPKKGATTTCAKTQNYNMGSLCAVLAQVHQRHYETKYYNTVAYVCRGLPAWNSNVEPLPQ